VRRVEEKSIAEVVKEIKANKGVEREEKVEVAKVEEVQVEKKVEEA
jgi:hypothetical protein